MAKDKVHLSKGVRDECGIEETVIETDVSGIRNVYGHIVGNVTIEDNEYIARHVTINDTNWFVDRLKGVYGRK